jgi:hypothetical protein
MLAVRECSQQEAPMQPLDPTVQALAERVAKLEAQNRTFRKALMAALVVASTIAVMGQARTSRVLEANEFILKDSSGTERAHLSVDTTIGPILTFYDNNRISASLHGGNEPLLYLNRAESKGSLMLRTSGLSIWGNTGSFHVDLGEEGPSLHLKDNEGYLTILGRTDLVTPASGVKQRTPAASLVLFGKDKKVLWSAP